MIVYSYRYEPYSDFEDAKTANIKHNTDVQLILDGCNNDYAMTK